MSIKIADRRGFAEVHADLIVAANTKISVRVAGSGVDGTLHGHVNRAQLSIGVLRDGPFVVVLGMADLAGIG